MFIATERTTRAPPPATVRVTCIVTPADGRWTCFERTRCSKRDKDVMHSVTEARTVHMILLMKKLHHI